MGDLFTIAAAVAALAVVARRRRPIRPGVAFLLALIAGAWLWANLRDAGWQAEWGGEAAPAELDPITRSMFYRGWPLSPFMFCLMHGLRFHPVGVEGLTLAFDWLVLLASLFSTRFACDRLLVPVSTDPYSVENPTPGRKTGNHRDSEDTETREK